MSDATQQHQSLAAHFFSGEACGGSGMCALVRIGYSTIHTTRAGMCGAECDVACRRGHTQRARQIPMECHMRNLAFSGAKKPASK